MAGLDRGAQRGWVYRVARNLSIDRYRTGAAGRVALRQAMDEVRRTATDVADAAEEAITRQRLAEVDRAIMALPEAQLVVVAMTAIAGMRAVDVAAAWTSRPGPYGIGCRRHDVPCGIC